ncbi:MAG: iron chelate uptake ABC transporter family permease subunit [Planctomycetes bacterium]|nr:iron chelate uptake ABC transporter family permease subunit [Planctomycetota bacterium]
MTRVSARWVIVVSAAALLGAVVVATMFGSTDIPAERIVKILAHRVGLPVNADWRPGEENAVLYVRLPRVLVGACVGAALALCGAAMQGIFRNPLASPGVLGVSTGASVGAILAIYLKLATYSVWTLPALATLGALGTAFVVYAIATRRGHTSVGTLLLAGIAMSSLNGAAASLILSLAVDEYKVGKEIVFWNLGSIEQSTWDNVLLVLPVVLVGSAIVLAYARDLDALLLGETQAASVGVDVARVRRRLIVATSLIIGAAVSVSGAVPFVGLFIPHILRLVMGPSHRGLFPASLLVGGAFLVLTDLFARTVPTHGEIRLGVITAAIGAPFFLFLLLKRHKEGLW